jgi:endonuclease/exonuclease/phosphatase family metal-dependent hydrolase
MMLFLSGLPVYGQDRTTAAVAAWNLLGFDPIPRTRIPYLVRAIVNMDPDVLAIVEVNPPSIPSELVAELIEIDLCYKRKILEQTAIQNIAILHRCNVTVTNPRLIPGSDDGDASLRKALAVNVKIGGFDFILIAVHLKSGQGSAEREMRDRQAKTIAAFIQTETAGAEKDVLVVGDYNMIPNDDQSNFIALSADNFISFISSEELHAGFTRISRNGMPGLLVDGFAISRQHTQEYIRGTLRIVHLYRTFDMTLQEFKDRVSDHLPLEAQFRITSDDD